MDALASKPDTFMREMGQLMSQKLDQTETDFKSFLLRKKPAICQWGIKDCPIPGSRNWFFMSKMILEKSRKRLLDVIDEWEKEQQIFENIRNEMIQYFNNYFIKIDEELVDIDAYVLGNSTQGQMAGNVDYTRHHLAKRRRFFEGKGKNKLNIGSVLNHYVLPKLGLKRYAQRAEDAAAEKRYQNDPAKEMKNITETLLVEMVGQPLRDHFAIQMTDLLALAHGLTNAAPLQIRGNRAVIEHIESEIRSNRETIEGSFRPVLEACEFYIADLDLHYLKAIRVYDIDSQNLTKERKISEGESH